MASVAILSAGLAPAPRFGIVRGSYVIWLLLSTGCKIGGKFVRDGGELLQRRLQVFDDFDKHKQLFTDTYLFMLLRIPGV